MRTVLGSLASVLVLTALTACVAPFECFTGDTPVATPQGPRPIASLAVGDEVYAFRPETHEVTVRRVTHIHRAEVDVVLDVDTGASTLTTTDQHPFWDAEQRTFRPAADLRHGDVLARLEGDGAMVPAQVASVRRRSAPGTPVWNITVDGEHTYFAAGIAVHNKSLLPAEGVDQVMPAPWTIRNDTRSAAPITLRTLPEGLSLRGDLLDGAAGRAILARALATAPATREISIAPSQSVQIPAVTITVEGLERGAALVTSADGTTSLLLDGASVVIVPSESSLIPDPRGSLGEVVSFRDVAATCASEVTALVRAEPTFKWTAPSGTSVTRWTIEAQSHDPALGWTLRFRAEDGRIASLSMRAPSAVWPGEVGQSVDVAADGDGKSVTMAWPSGGAGRGDLISFSLREEDGRELPFRFPSSSEGEFTTLLASEDDSCLPAPTACGAMRLPVAVSVGSDRAPVTASTPLVEKKSNGLVASTYVLDATSAPVSAACDRATSSLVIATVVRAP